MNTKFRSSTLYWIGKSICMMLHPLKDDVLVQQGISKMLLKIVRIYGASLIPDPLWSFYTILSIGLLRADTWKVWSRHYICSIYICNFNRPLRPIAMLFFSTPCDLLLSLSIQLCLHFSDGFLSPATISIWGSPAF